MHAAYPAAGAAAAAAVAVLAGGMPRALLAALALPALVVLAAWSIPAWVLLVARVVLTKAIHLSRLLEEEEEEKEEEGEEGEGEGEGAGRRDAGGTKRSNGELGRGLGWEGVRGRAAVQQWEWNHRRQQRQKKRRERREGRGGEEEGWEGQEEEEEEEEYQQQEETRGWRRTRRSERRIDVEWDGGQLFLVVRRVVASEFLVNLVNR